LRRQAQTALYIELTQTDKQHRQSPTIAYIRTPAPKASEQIKPDVDFKVEQARNNLARKKVGQVN
jgi:hypothetical protein